MNLFSKVAHNYDKYFGRSDINDIIEYIPVVDDELFFDLGGGTGRDAFQLKDKVNGSLVFDANYKMLQQAQKKSQDLMLVQGLAESLPIRSNSLKQIFLNDSLHHIQKQEETLAECFRVLEPGGLLIIREFDRKYFWNKFLIFAEKLLMFRSKFLSPKQLSEMCQELGFETSFQRPSKATYILVAKKCNPSK